MSNIFVEKKRLVFEKFPNEIGIFDQNVKIWPRHQILHYLLNFKIYQNYFSNFFTYIVYHFKRYGVQYHCFC